MSQVMHLVVPVIPVTAWVVLFLALTLALLLGEVTASSDMIPVLSNLHTQTLGSWTLGIFYVGAIATLHGTVFAATAAHSRLFADLCRLRADSKPMICPPVWRCGTASS